MALTTGLVLNTAFGPIVDMAAYAFAPQSLIAPFGGLDVVWNTLSAPYTLGETLTRPRILGCSLIAGGGLFLHFSHVFFCNAISSVLSNPLLTLALSSVLSSFPYTPALLLCSSACNLRNLILFSFCPSSPPLLLFSTSSSSPTPLLLFSSVPLHHLAPNHPSASPLQLSSALLSSPQLSSALLGSLQFHSALLTSSQGKFKYV